jgi:hypothetical protein
MLVSALRIVIDNQGRHDKVFGRLFSVVFSQTG